MAINVKSFINWVKKLPIKIIIIFVLLFLIGLLIFNISTERCWPPALGKTKTGGKCEIGTLIVQLRYAIGGVIALLVAVASFERARALDKTAEAQNQTADAQNETVKAQNKTARAQEQGNIEERYKNAITQFGNKNSSVRLGGAYGLYYLAIDNEDRRRNICNVLCVHIREITTSEVAVGKNSDGKEIKYSEKYKTNPSNEVQSILDLLTNKDNKEDFPFKSHWINLAYAYLNGANLINAQLQGANLARVQLQGAYLRRVQLQGAHLYQAQLQGAYLWNALLQEANLIEAQLQGANLRDGQLQGAILDQAELQGADLDLAQLRGAYLGKAYLQGANLNNGQLQGAYLRNAQLQGAILSSAQFQRVDLSEAQFQGANLDKTDFRGAFTEQNSNRIFGIDAAIYELDARRYQKTNIKGVIFSGGVTAEQLENFKKTTTETLDKLAKITDYDQNKINDFKQAMKKVEEILQSHNENKKKANYKFPREYIKTIKKGVYPEAEVEKIIKILEAAKNMLKKQ